MDLRPVLQQVDRRPQEVRTPGSLWPDIRRLLVVRHDRLGDVVLSLPAVAALREAYPHALLALMVRPANVPLARCVGGVDEVIEFTGDAGELRTRMLGLRPDLLVCISRTPAVAKAAWRAGVRHRLGPGFRLYSPLFERRVDEHRRRGERHELEYAMSFAHCAGAVPCPARFPLRVPPTEEQAARDWLSERKLDMPFVVIHPGSGGSCPAWPVERFVALASLLTAAGTPVVYSVGPVDHEVAGRVRGEAGEATLCFEGDLPALTALLSRAALVISNSTGPLHLAAALGRPTLALHAPWRSCGVSRWGPYAENGWGLAVDHPDALRWSHRERRQRAAEMMAAIPAECVRDCALDMLAGRSPRVR